MKRAVLLAGLLCAGCATVGSYQEGCERQTRTFPAMAQCIKDSLASDWRLNLRRDAWLKLYTLKLDQLSDRVQRREMSEVDARVALQDLYVRMKDAEAAEDTRAASVRCLPSGSGVVCY